MTDKVTVILSCIGPIPLPLLISVKPPSINSDVIIVVFVCFRHTGYLENFYSMMTKYAPKRMAFE